MITTSTSGRGSHHRLVHLGRAAHANDLVDRRRLEPGGTGHERDVGAAPARFIGQRKTHAAARPVADVPHRIDVLVGRTGGDQHLLRRPAQTVARAGREPASTRSAAATMSAGSASRPFPTQPHAR